MKFPCLTMWVGRQYKDNADNDAGRQRWTMHDSVGSPAFMPNKPNTHLITEKLPYLVKWSFMLKQTTFNLVQRAVDIYSHPKSRLTRVSRFASVSALEPVPTERSRLRLRRRKQLGSVNFYATIHI